MTFPGERRSVRLMTYNIHRWAGRDKRLDVARTADVIRMADADIVGLNEVLNPIDISGRQEEPLRELAETLGMHYAFGASGWIDRGPGWRGPVGNAILSRSALSDVSNVGLPRFLGSKRRSLLGATLTQGPAAGLTVFVTHLDHAFEGTRLFQVNGILRHIRSRRAHFLMGDFNTPGLGGRFTRKLLPPVLRRLRGQGYHDAFHHVGVGEGLTFPASSPFVRIDFLFFPDDCAQGLRSARALDQTNVHSASDHRPVVAEWAWPSKLPNWAVAS